MVTVLGMYGSRMLTVLLCTWNRFYLGHVQLLSQNKMSKDVSLKEPTGKLKKYYTELEPYSQSSLTYLT